MDKWTIYIFGILTGAVLADITHPGSDLRNWVEGKPTLEYTPPVMTDYTPADRDFINSLRRPHER